MVVFTSVDVSLFTKTYTTFGSFRSKWGSNRRTCLPELSNSVIV